MRACLWTESTVVQSSVREWSVALDVLVVEVGVVDELKEWVVPDDSPDIFGAWCMGQSFSHGVVVDDADGSRWWAGVDASETGLDVGSIAQGSQLHIEYEEVENTVAGSIISVLLANADGPLFGGANDLSMESLIPVLGIALGAAQEQRYRSTCMSWVDVGLVFQADADVEILPRTGAQIEVDGVPLEAFVPVSRQAEKVRCTETESRRNQWFVSRPPR